MPESPKPSDVPGPGSRFLQQHIGQAVEEICCVTWTAAVEAALHSDAEKLQHVDEEWREHCSVLSLLTRGNLLTNFRLRRHLERWKVKKVKEKVKEK